MARTYLASRWRPWAFLFIGVVGCGQPPDEDDRLASVDPARMVPFGGVVTFNGEPREAAVLTFLPPSGLAVATGETDQDGKYELKCQGRPGIPPGEYKVSISYLVSDKGEPQGLGPRSSQYQPPGMLTAKEQLPAEYSNLGRTKILVKVGPEGGQFNYDVPVSIPAPPKADEPEEEEEGAERKSREAEAAPAKPG